MSESGEQPGRPLRIVLPGGSGQVGRMLARFFQERGHHVTVLTRGPYTAAWQTVHWDGRTLGPWVETLEGADVCIHAATPRATAASFTFRASDPCACSITPSPASSIRRAFG
jgi:nucleoside-diphosphate-sugar epimerase